MTSKQQQQYNFPDNDRSLQLPLLAERQHNVSLHHQYNVVHSAKHDFAVTTPFPRQSTFQKQDIEGTCPKTLIPKIPHQTNYSLSTFVEPVPGRKINKTSNQLHIDDIEGTRPKATEFKTNRMVNPLCPQYLLPSVNEIAVDKGRNFVRDTLQISDINAKRRQILRERGIEALREPIPGSQPGKLTKTINGANSRLQVTDINKDGIFQTKRTTNPLNPQYKWRDERQSDPNPTYGVIHGDNPRRLHPQQVNRPIHNLDTKDIQGATSNSAFTRAHFIEQRRQFRNYMNIADIQKTASSSLKKGIDTKRVTNPLVPNYQFPGRLETTN